MLSAAIYNSQNTEVTFKSTNGGMDKDVVYIHGVLLQP